MSIKISPIGIELLKELGKNLKQEFPKNYSFTYLPRKTFYGRNISADDGLYTVNDILELSALELVEYDSDGYIYLTLLGKAYLQQKYKFKDLLSEI